MKKLLRIKYACGIFFLLLFLQACAIHGKYIENYDIRSDENSIDITYKTYGIYEFNILQTAKIHCIKYNKDAVLSSIENDNIYLYFEDISQIEDQKLLKNILEKAPENYLDEIDFEKTIIVSFLCK